MRWPPRVLLLPHRALRSLRAFVRARAGASSDLGSRMPQTLPMVMPDDPLEFDLSTTPEPDPDAVPTKPASVRALAEVPGPPKPPSLFPRRRRP